MYFIILDLEATCWQGNDMDRRQEIIELAAHRLNGYGEWIDQFQSFIRPVDHPRLSAYCTELTGIRQEQVDKARSFDHAFPHFQDWMDLVETPQTICTWGDKDIPIIREEAARHDIDLNGLGPSIDMKAQYPKLNGLKKEISLQKAMEYHGLEFEGHQHRALDDAYNTARLFLCFLDRWVY